jgi:hypothetical protein
VLNCTHPKRMPPNLFGGGCHQKERCKIRQNGKTTFDVS